MPKLLALTTLLAVVSSTTLASAQEPDVDCSIKPKRTYSIKALKRAKAVTVPTTCDGATEALVTFEVDAPLPVSLNTPHHGRPDASGDAAFAQAGTKPVRLKLHKKTVRAIRNARRIKVSFHLAVEIPDEPGAYYGVPNDVRHATFR
jgi:hypothetical protein